ncbi:MAG: hypothetical protein HOW73_42180 [Polyangiaceae bacterium]|nr:hypothetical protein [Polyangiaceae bacterium]
MRDLPKDVPARAFDDLRPSVETEAAPTVASVRPAKARLSEPKMGEPKMGEPKMGMPKLAASKAAPDSSRGTRKPAKKRRASVILDEITSIC